MAKNPPRKRPDRDQRPSLLLQFRAWIEDENQHVAKRFELREHLFEHFRTEGVDMPFETIQLAPFEHRATALAA